MEHQLFLLGSCRDRMVALFITAGRGKVAVQVVRGAQLGLRPMGSALGSFASVVGQPGHGEGASALLIPLYHCRVPQAPQLPALLQVMPFSCLFSGFPNPALSATLDTHLIPVCFLCAFPFLTVHPQLFISCPGKLCTH